MSCDEGPVFRPIAPRLSEDGSVSRSSGRPSTVAVGALVTLVAFLRLDAEGRDRAGFKATDADGFGGLLAIAVGAVFDPLQCRLDLRDELAGAVSRAKLDRPLRLDGGSIPQIRLVPGIELSFSRVASVSSRMPCRHISSLRRKYSRIRGDMNSFLLVGLYLAGSSTLFSATALPDPTRNGRGV